MNKKHNEEMIDMSGWTNPNPTTPPPSPPGSSIYEHSKCGNWTITHSVRNMTSAELQEYADAVNAEIKRRKTTRAKELIDKICVQLNELRDLGNTSFFVPLGFEDEVYDILAEEIFFDKNMFKIYGEE